MTKEKYNEIAELNYALAQKSDTIHQLVEQMAELNERCSELETQIEKMRNCANCKKWILELISVVRIDTMKKKLKENTYEQS